MATAAAEISKTITVADEEFLGSLGITPYNVQAYEIELRERFRTRMLRAIALLQAAGILAALYWTMTN